MREYQRKQILEIIDSLHSMHKSIENEINKNNSDYVFNALVECQETAIGIGEAIENIEGSDNLSEDIQKVITNLEKYCEGLYIINTQYETYSGYKAHKLLKEKLLNVENALKNLTVRYLVVFLPYKADMWDSLESVWKKLDADPNYDAYVVPIPYYDKNPDGSFKVEHYEIGRYPEDVPLMDYHTINLEELHPDSIYIHNPYDEFNYVTSVHPAFYSSKICNYTDDLVYIPYFVHQNDYVKEDYVCVPGVVYANRVILQSKSVAEQYKKIYEKEFKTKTDKFYGTGSPKLEGYKNNIDKIPKEWEEYILVNGHKNKVILLNTHLSCLMQGKSEDFFIKIHEVFETFRDNKDKVTLLWRPHPLSLTTAESMNPEAITPYLELIEWYKKEKIGIYDDSSDIHRAVNLSDAYYGNRSSVVEMFKAQKKPIMIMNLELHE